MKARILPRLLAALPALAAGHAVCGTALAQQAIPTMTIQILNNAGGYNLYPVLSVGQGGATLPDQWMQAYFSVPAKDLGTQLYPRTYLYRMYINPTGSGIPAHAQATITLPLYTQLATTIDPTKGDQLIDWWQGGGVRMFQSGTAAGKPPPALARNYANPAVRPDQQPVTTAAGAAVPTCTLSTGGACSVYIFRDTAELGLGDPFQLTEYTLGAVATNEVPYILNTRNVDFDVSYVDSIFSPLMMEPYPNAKKIWGWVGINMQVSKFKAILQKFLTNYHQWPQFLDNRGVATLKIPSPLNIFVGNEFNARLNEPFPRGDLTPLPWGPVQKLVDGWSACTVDCADQGEVAALLQANYDNYKQNYGSQQSWACDPAKTPVRLTDMQVLGHVYGWSPYNTYCASDANQLYQTPGYFTPGNPPVPAKYEEVKAKFDQLQLVEAFDPYVALIHGADYLNAKYAYAYSVDDAVGNVQVDGETGFYIAIGSAAGLPNQSPLGSYINLAYGWGPNNSVNFTEYGVCTTTPDTKVNIRFASFVAPGKDSSKCPISFVDSLGRTYHFTIATPPPYATTPSHTMIDCRGNDANGAAWCQGIFGYSPVVPGGQQVNYVIAGAPPQ